MPVFSSKHRHIEVKHINNHSHREVRVVGNNRILLSKCWSVYLSFATTISISISATVAVTKSATTTATTTAITCSIETGIHRIENTGNIRVWVVQVLNELKIHSFNNSS